MVLYYKSDTPIKCQTGWTGRNCDACAPNFGPPGQCAECFRGFAGENCNECVTNFGPPGNCNRCVLGWTGDNCDVCEFGFSRESNCTECIQNGYWTGTYSQAPFPLRAYLTFEGPVCSNLAPGMYSDLDRIHWFLPNLNFFVLMGITMVWTVMDS